MGCGRSTLVPDDEAPAALRPARRRIQDVGRWRSSRVRKDSIVSTTELLRVEESEAGDDAVSVAGDLRSTALAEEEVEEEVEKRVVVVEEGRGEEKRELGLGFGNGGKVEVKPRAAAALEEEEELPGSPSLRFYFEDSALELLTEGESADVAGEAVGKPKVEKAHKREDSIASVNSSKESQCKSVKKGRGKRLRSLRLKRGHSAVHNMLSPRSCYNINSCGGGGNNNNVASACTAPQPLN